MKFDSLTFKLMCHNNKPLSSSFLNRGEVLLKESYEVNFDSFYQIY